MVAQIDWNYVKTRPVKAVTRLMSYALFEGRPVTTRGRWINPVVFAHFAVEKRLPQLKRVNKPIFILGTGRSGTTILGVVMSMHRQVGFLNEPKALWHAVHPAEDVLGNYSRGEAHYRLGTDEATVGATQRAQRLFGAYLAATGSKRLVDKYPELVFRIPFVRAIFPDARFVLLLRNGFDTISSIDAWSRQHLQTEHGEVHDWWGVDGRKWRLMRNQLVASDPAFADLGGLVEGLDRQIDMATVEWIVTMREAITQRRQNSDCVLTVRYEDLAANPRKMLVEIADFAELAHDEKFLAYGESVLRPGGKHSMPDLNPQLQPLFERTMHELGY
ncbi:MAG: sulfotransferase family protein [Gammaproteobacteria bacterium]